MNACAIFLIVLAVATCGPGKAQQVGKDLPASRVGMRPASDVLARIGQSANVTVLTESAIKDRVSLELAAAPATRQTVEARIAAVVSVLPEGTKVTKLYLPALAGGRAWNADDVTAYAIAQHRLFGAMDADSSGGAVTILGQRFEAEKAKRVLADLNLSVVYLVTNPGARAAAVQNSGGAGDLNRWLQMTPEQKQRHAQQQAAQMLNMDPATRQEAIQQQRMVFGQLIRQMPPEQRDRLFRDMQIRPPGSGTNPRQRRTP